MNVAVIGGGLFGCQISIDLAALDFVDGIDLYEKNSDLMREASYNNQHRLHMGYHYPRSSETIKQILSTNASFMEKFNDCTFPIESNLYLIAKDNSLTNSKKFAETFESHNISEVALKDYERYLKVDMLQAGFLVDEKGLNNSAIRKKVTRNIAKSNKVTLHFNHEIENVESLKHDLIINCSYRDFSLSSETSMKYEICILSLVKNPFDDQRFAFTVMDGKFPSLYPTENEEVFTLSHVEKTPIFKSNSLLEAKEFRKNLSDHDIDRANREIIEMSSDFFKMKFEPIGQYLSYKVKRLNDKNDVRTSDITFSGNKISILQGKITTVCHVSNEIVTYAKNHFDRKGISR